MKSLPHFLPRAVLFDHDGVLVASESLHQAAWRKLLPILGIPYHDSEVQARVGMTAPQILTDLLNLHRPGWDSKEYDVQALAKRKNDFYLELTKTELKPYPGVPELLKWLRQNGIKIAVVSNAKRRELEGALRTLGLLDLFDVIASRDDSGASKPDPMPYLFAAASVGVEPKDCLAVEDSPPGLEAALIAKIPAAAVLTNFKRPALENPVPGRPDLKPVWIGESIQLLFDWLRSLPKA